MTYLAFLAGFILGGLFGGVWALWQVFRGMTNLARELDRRPKAEPPVAPPPAAPVVPEDKPPAQTARQYPKEMQCQSCGFAPLDPARDFPPHCQACYRKQSEKPAPVHTVTFGAPRAH